jgi:hypothetical protein
MRNHPIIVQKYGRIERRRGGPRLQKISDKPLAVPEQPEECIPFSAT